MVEVLPVKQESRPPRRTDPHPLAMRPNDEKGLCAGGDGVGESFPEDDMAVKHTKPQTAVDDDPDACTSMSPTPPALAAQRSYADAWCTPSAPPRQTGRSIPANAPVPFPGPVHPAPQDPSPSANSGASVRRSQAPSVSPAAQ